MIDSSLLGQTAAKCMEDLDDSESLDGGEVLGVAIIVVAQNADGTISTNRTYCSDTTYYKQLGIFEAAVECIKDGERFSPPSFGGDDDSDGEEE